MIYIIHIVLCGSTQLNNRIIYTIDSDTATMQAFISTIMEYGSTPYVGMALEKNGFPIQCVQNDMLRTLL